MIFLEAVEFVKTQAASITKMLTKEHYKMMDQYFNARQLVNEKLERCDLLEELHK